MALVPERGHAALRRGRFSLLGATYFLTICTKNRQRDLTSAVVAGRLADEREAMEKDATWHVRCATVMPDHLHLLIVLGERLALGRAIGRLKARTSSALREIGCEWERGAFDHRLRSEEPVLPVFHYLFMNPYRTGLLSREVSWPHFYCAPDDRVWFSQHAQGEVPLPEWLGEADRT
jgi:putative transposase